MAKYNFDVSGSQLIVSLVPVESDVQPTSMSYLAPSFKIGVGKINAYEYGQPKQSFLFTEIGEIDGVAPTDLQDTFDKITTATANFNGGGTAPYKVYTALLTQSEVEGNPVALVFQDELGVTLEPFYDGFPGEYGFTIDGGFPEGKTFIPNFGRMYGEGAITYLPIIKSFIDNPLVRWYYTFYYSEGYIYTYFIDHLGNKVDLASIGDGITFGKTEIPIEIQVYN
jgi:hypothetical protein